MVTSAQSEAQWGEHGAYRCVSVRIGAYVALFWASMATAAPPVPTHQGRVLSADGLPLNGAFDVSVSLFDEVDSSSPFWTRTFGDVPVEEGYYAVRLVTDNSGSALDPAEFGDGEVWLQASVDGQPLGGRERLGSVPYAMVSGGVRLPSAEAGDCDTPGLMGYDENSGEMLLCHAGAFQVVAVADSAPDGSSDTIVGVRNSGQNAEWALLQVTEPTPIPNMAAWRQTCIDAVLGVPASVENNVNCLGNVGDPRYIVTSDCNMLDQGGDTWRANLATFQSGFSGGNMYFLRYSNSGNAQWTRFSCSAAQVGDRSEDTCGNPRQSSTASFTLNPGEWLCCARPN